MLEIEKETVLWVLKNNSGILEFMPSWQIHNHIDIWACSYVSFEGNLQISNGSAYWASYQYIKKNSENFETDIIIRSHPRESNQMECIPWSQNTSQSTPAHHMTVWILWLIYDCDAMKGQSWSNEIDSIKLHTLKPPKTSLYQCGLPNWVYISDLLAVTELLKQRSIPFNNQLITI